MKGGKECASSDEDEIGLSYATLMALKEFALDRGICVGTGEEKGKELEAQSTLKAIREALDTQAKEDTFQYTFGKEDEEDFYVIELNGLRRDIGQTLQSTGLTLWRAADTLSDFLFAKRTIFAGKRIIELGSGLGLCGILAWHLAGSEGKVIITDGDDDTIDLLKQNAKLNGIQDTDKMCRKLMWGEELGDLAAETFDFIIGSDIIYEEEFVDALFHTVKALIKPSTRFLLAYTKRNVSIVKVLGIASSVGLTWTEPETDEGVYEFRLHSTEP